jgi:hypothetical protein
MYLALPPDVPISVPTPDFLVEDKTIEDIDLHPGDEVFVLGFPLAASSPGGFPILRTGHIASYPLTPMESIKQISLDLFLYAGNSGGPVYYLYVNRYFKGTIHSTGYQGMLGLVTQEARSTLRGEYFGKPLNLATIIPAPLIRETIALLPTEP